MFKSMMIAAAVVALGTAGAAAAQDRPDDRAMQQDGRAINREGQATNQDRRDIHQDIRSGDRRDLGADNARLRADSGRYSRDRALAHDDHGRYFHNGRYYRARHHHHGHWMYR